MTRSIRDLSDYERPANRPFVRYDERGAITSFGHQARGIVWDAQDRGERIAFGEGNDQDHYVDLTVDPPELRERPEIDWGFDRVEIQPREAATLPDVPPAIVGFVGPVTGTQPHETTGPLEIGWTLPGVYTLTVEAFPYKKIQFELTVKP